jgi:hypothetical protein
VPAGTFVPGEMKNVLRDLPSVHGPCLMKCRLILAISPLARGIGPISSTESTLKVTYGNVGGKKIFTPAAGFRPQEGIFKSQIQAPPLYKP